MKLIASLEDVFDQFDVAVLDQWGVMHNGSKPYTGATKAMEKLRKAQKKIVVVSNSGKRSELNLQRIERIGLPARWIDQVVTSGETLWEQLDSGQVKIGDKKIESLYPITGKSGDADEWAGKSSKITIVHELDAHTDAILLMGLPDGSRESEYDSLLDRGLELRCPLICSNPDKKSPRDGGLVLSPGALADRYQQRGGIVLWYGKPHANIYQAVVNRFPSIELDRFLMVGDSLEHDIAGAQRMGMSCVLVCGGIHAPEFAGEPNDEKLIAKARQLATSEATTEPDYLIRLLA